MQSKHQFSNLVYEYFFMRLQFRNYKYGDYLPSIDTLCQEFSVSSQTVKTALRRLRAEGLIDMRNGRSTKIIFRQTEEQARQYAFQYFSTRVHGFQDLYESTQLVIMPLLLEGFRRTSGEDLSYLSHLADGTKAEDVLHFFCFILQKMDNPLAMNLYWEISVFWGLLFLKEEREKDLGNVTLMHEKMKSCVLLAEQKDWPFLYEELKSFRRISIGNTVSMLEQAVTPAQEDEQTSFSWRIYHGRPQICYSLASTLLHEMYMGRFKEMEFLPSYNKMAEIYDASVSTVRRTIDILRQLGTVRPVNGKGIQIFGIGNPGSPPNFESPLVRRSLAFFVQSFELLAYSCEPVLRTTLSEITAKEWDALVKELEDNIDTGRSELSLWNFLLFIHRHSRLKGIREIYGHIYSLFQWGYPLKASSDAAARLEETMLHFTEVMLRSLKEHDIEHCVDTMKKLVDEQFPAAERYLLSQGIRPDELRLTPAIRFLVTADC